jgi:hypothetical protein
LKTQEKINASQEKMKEDYQMKFFNKIIDEAENGSKKEVLTLSKDYYSLALYAFYLDDYDLDQVKSENEGEMNEALKYIIN